MALSPLGQSPHPQYLYINSYHVLGYADGTWPIRSPMGLMSIEGTIDFELQDCLFPVLTRRSSNDCSYKTISLFDYDSHIKPLGKETSGCTRGLLASWAILLRFYLVRDTVSFVCTSKANTNARELKTQRPLQDGHDNAEVLYFDVQDQDRLCDVKNVSTKLLMPGESPVNRINTAVHLRTALLPDFRDGDHSAVLEQTESSFKDAPGSILQVCLSFAKCAIH